MLYRSLNLDLPVLLLVYHGERTCCRFTIQNSFRVRTIGIFKVASLVFLEELACLYEGVKS
jgi:hypothetical protein